MGRSFLKCVLVVLCALPLSGLSQELAPNDDIPRNNLLLTTFFVGRYYPIGLDAQVSLVYQRHLGDSQELLWKTRFVGVSATATYNPAEWSLQAAAQWEPIAVFQLKVAGEYRGFPGGFGEILSFNTPNPSYDDASVDAASRAGLNYATHRTTLRVEPKLRAAFGPIGLENTFSAIYGNTAVRAGDTSYYDPGMDVLRPANGMTLVNQLAAVYLGERWAAGALHEWTIPMGLDGHQVQRIGLLGSYTFYENKQAWVNKPSVFLLALFNVVHPGRAGPMPTLVVGLTTETDLLAHR